MGVRNSGGKKTKKVLRDVRKRGGKFPHIDLGFFNTARYPSVTTGIKGGKRQTPHFVATVAAWNEFGTSNGVPERPFFRNAINETATDQAFKELLVKVTDAKSMTISRPGLDLVGKYIKGKLQRSIVDLRQPPNAPITIKRKGSKNPLVNVGTMKNAVAFAIGESSRE